MGQGFKQLVNKIVNGTGVFSVILNTFGVVAQFFVAPASQYSSLPMLRTYLLNPTQLDTAFESGSVGGAGTGFGKLEFLTGTNFGDFDLSASTILVETVDIHAEATSPASPGFPCQIRIRNGSGTNFVYRSWWDGTTSFTQFGDGSVGERLGFYGQGTTVRPTVTGSRSGVPAVASLLSALFNLGLIIDNSTP